MKKILVRFSFIKKQFEKSRPESVAKSYFDIVVLIKIVAMNIFMQLRESLWSHENKFLIEALVWLRSD